MKKKLRTIQPAHESDKITVEQAMEVWRRVEGKIASGASKSPVRRLSRAGASPRARVTAEGARDRS